MQLLTLGEFALWPRSEHHPARNGDDTPTQTPILRASKPLALLTVAALSPGRRVSRHEILDLLWERADPELSAQTLRQTIFTLRKRIGADTVGLDGGVIWVSDTLALDAQAFEDAVNAGDLDTAWSLYRGPFLGGEAVKGAPAFAHWADQQRSHFASRRRSVGDALVQRELAAQRVSNALAVLDALLREAPDDLDLWQQQIEARLLAGDAAGARADAKHVTERIEQEELAPSDELRALLRRLRDANMGLLRDGILRSGRATRDRRHDDAPGVPRTDAPSVDQRAFVGRAAVVTQLLASWQQVGRGHGVLHAVIGGAGIGKTRVLRECRDRLVDLGARTLLLRATPSDRSVAYALTATVTEALAALPGSAGISSAAAGVLIDLVPSLSNRFPNAQRVSSDPEELPRLRLLAVKELLEAVAEERPVALLLDDLHWADSASRQLLASLGERLATLPVLLVITFREARGGIPLPADAVTTELPPLSLSAITELLRAGASGSSRAPSDNAGSPDDGFYEQLAATLHQVTGGIPLLILAAIELAVAREWLLAEGGRWWTPDLARLQRELASGGELLDRLLEDVPDDGLSVLRAAALVQQPLSRALLDVVVPTPQLAAVLQQLEQRGMLVQLSEEWEISHDRLADAVLRTLSNNDRVELSRRIARGLAVHGDARAWERAARLLLAAHRLASQATRQVEADIVRLFRQWLAARNRPRFWQRPRLAAAIFLGDDGTVTEVQRLSRVVPVVDRFRFGYPRFAAVTALSSGVLGIAAVVRLLGVAGHAPATQMRLEPVPTERGIVWAEPASDSAGQSAGEVESRIPLRVTFRDERGMLTSNAPSRALVRLAESSDEVRLVGDSIVPVQRGEANFENVRVRGVGRFRLRVDADSFSSLTPRIYATSEHWVSGRRTRTRELRILDGEINGQRFDSVTRTISVPPGAEISGLIRYRTVTNSRAALILMGVIGLWGDRTTNFLELQSLPSFGETTDTVRLLELASRRRLRAPMEPGDYRMLFVWDTETSMRFIASRTNWQVQTPRWNDGNDLADLPASVLDSLTAGHVIKSPVIYSGSPSNISQPYRLRTRTDSAAIAGDVLRVRVVPASR